MGLRDSAAANQGNRDISCALTHGALLVSKRLDSRDDLTGDVLDVLGRVPFVPGKHKDTAEGVERAGIVFRSLRGRRVSAARAPRPPAPPERDAIPNHLALKRRLLDVAERGVNSSLLQECPQAIETILEARAVDSERILPVHVLAARGHGWRLDPGKLRE